MDLDLTEVAQLLNVSPTTVRRWLAQELIPAYKINRQYRFNRAEIENWVLSHRVNTRGEGEARPEGGSWRYSLYRSLCRGGVSHDIEGVTKEQLIRSVTQQLARDFSLDGEALAALLLERERLMSTGIGHGLAVPHTRDFLLPMRFDVIRLVFPKEPIDYDALDQQPVHSLFFLFACDDKRHLHLLAKLAHFANRPESQALLRRRPSSPELLAYVKEWESSLS
jgi:nitrogen PTS system EIIA component